MLNYNGHISLNMSVLLLLKYNQHILTNQTEESNSALHVLPTLYAKLKKIEMMMSY